MDLAMKPELLTPMAAAASDERVRFARDITRAFERSRESIFEVGRLLIEAKAKLAHGSFEAMVESDLPFRPSTARRLMAIAADERLSNRAHVHVLPPHWGTLYEITKLSDQELARRIEDGTINPTMERRDISTVVKAERRAAREIELSNRILALPDKEYGVMVEDYEWDHVTYSDRGKDRHASNHYLTSSDAHTAAEIVERTADRFKCAAANCVLFMWTTQPHLAIAIDVLRFRGFEYRSNAIWKKDRPGTGYWFTNWHEQLLVGVRGDVPCPAPGDQWDSWIEQPKGEHSAKPEAFLEMVESYFPNLPKIELNRRGPPRPGWDSWGFDAPQPSPAASSEANPSTSSGQLDLEAAIAEAPAGRV